MALDFSRLYEIFSIPESEYQVTEINHGHINQTFLVTGSGLPQYILQQVNTAVFKDTAHLMDNYRLVSDTLADFVWPEGYHLSCPKLIHTRDNKAHHCGGGNGCWRLVTYIEGSDCADIAPNPKTAYQGGLAFGLFLTGVSGIQPDRIYEILPEFHSLFRRYNEFSNALSNASATRIQTAEKEITFVKSRLGAMKVIPDALSTGEIPIRVVHNDTKLSNVLFNPGGEFTGVIDLDTVMAGSALFDFGDAIRSSANTACEDEQDLEKVNFEPGLFDAFSKGYIETAGAILTKAETDLLPESALLMTYIIGLRFLTDYLNGDTYFRTQYETHNLVRAKVQFRLLEQMESSITAMHTIIEKHLNQLHAEPNIQNLTE